VNFVDEECIDVVMRKFSQIRRHNRIIVRICRSLMAQQISANPHQNHPIQV